MLAEVPECGRSYQQWARPGLYPHAHPDAFEVCLLTRGQVNWWVEERGYTLSAGDVFITQPGERHGAIGSIVQPCELYWVQFVVDDLSGWDHDGKDSLRRALALLPERFFHASSGLAACIMALVTEHRRSDQYSKTAARAALQTALIAIVRESSEAHKPSLSRPVQQALIWMTDRIEEPFNVEEVAAAVGFSAARLQARFQQEMSTSVGEHRSRLRLQRAKELLAGTDVSVTEIAHRLSFPSSQYFATFFRRRVGVTPSRYRQQVLAHARPHRRDSDQIQRPDDRARSRRPAQHDDRRAPQSTVEFGVPA